MRKTTQGGEKVGKLSTSRRWSEIVRPERNRSTRAIGVHEHGVVVSFSFVALIHLVTISFHVQSVCWETAVSF